MKKKGMKSLKTLTLWLIDLTKKVNPCNLEQSEKQKPRTTRQVEDYDLKTKRAGEYLLMGYTMLSECCEGISISILDCLVPFYRDRKGVVMCPGCDRRIEIEKPKTRGNKKIADDEKNEKKSGVQTAPGASAGQPENLTAGFSLDFNNSRPKNNSEPSAINPHITNQPAASFPQNQTQSSSFGGFNAINNASANPWNNNLQSNLAGYTNIGASSVNNHNFSTKQSSFDFGAHQNNSTNLPNGFDQVNLGVGSSANNNLFATNKPEFGLGYQGERTQVQKEISSVIGRIIL